MMGGLERDSFDGTGRFRMKRREFLILLGGAAAAFPDPVSAQQSMPVIGMLIPESRDKSTPRFRAFHEGLSETGFAEGRNVAVEYRWTNGNDEGWLPLAADLVRRPVAVIVSLGGLRTATAAKAATATIPIVIQGGFDPVARGIVTSLSRPGGNITGVSTLNTQLGPKRLELLHELIPSAKVVALLVNPSNPDSEDQLVAMRAAARTFGLDLHVLHARTERDFAAVFARVKELRAAGLLISNASPFNGRSDELGALAASHAVPAIFQSPEFVAAGGFVSYGASTADAWRLAGLYTGRILKGDKPANLPVQQVAKIEMVINLKTAKALGINVPLPLLGRADEVIE
jgi:putative ABC transport system substrate-binding protein